MVVKTIVEAIVRQLVVVDVLLDALDVMDVQDAQDVLLVELAVLDALDAQIVHHVLELAKMDV